ncbi:hypothetical protein MOSE0_M05842 [Monosporozyma servazzii]
MDVSIYKKRRKIQMLRFFGATAITLLSCRLTMRHLTAPTTTKTVLKYKPNLFQLNHKIPLDIVANIKRSSAANQKSAAIFPAVIGTVGITSGLFLMGITGTLWTQNVCTLREWKQLGKDTTQTS